MRMLHKKAMVFNVMLVIFTLIVLIYAYSRLSAKMAVGKEIGESQLQLVSKIQEGEKALIFLDSAARMAIYQAIYDLQAKGGITETSSCGVYYGFNKWNDKTGQSCFVDSTSAKDALRNLFVSDLVARVAKYPTADFIGYVPEVAVARGAALAAVPPAGVSVAAPSVAAACQGELDNTIDFMYDTPYFVKEKNSRVWIPAQANCAGAYPLIVFLHGNAAVGETLFDGFGDGKTKDHIPIAKKLISSGKMQPVILAAPFMTAYPGLPKGASIKNSMLWKGFDPKNFVEEVKKNLPQGITISTISYTGFSGAGCVPSLGIYQAAKDMPSLYAVGQFDTCDKGPIYGAAWKSRLGQDTKYVVMYGSMKEGMFVPKALDINKKIECPQTEVSGAKLSDCNSDSTGKYYAMTTNNNHEKGKVVGFEQFFKMFFPPQTAASATTTTKAPASQAGVS